MKRSWLLSRWIVFACLVFFISASQAAGYDGPLVTCSGSSMATAARNGVIAWGAGQVLGCIMQDIFPGSGAATQAQVEMLNKKLDAIKLQLDKLSEQVEEGNLIIKQEIMKAEFNIGSMLLTDYVVMIEKTYSDLKTELEKNTQSLNPEQIQKRKTTINHLLDTIENRIEPQVGTLHRHLMGKFDMGLMAVYTDKIEATQRFLTNDNYRSKVIAFFQYYNHIEAIETYLALEYYNARGLSSSIVKARIKELEDNSQKELAWINSRRAIPDDIVLFYAMGLMYYLPANYIQTMTMPIEATRYRITGWNWGGYRDWRIPTRSEIVHIFDHWTGSPGTFAAHQGFNRMCNGRYFGWITAGKQPVIHEYRPNFIGGKSMYTEINWGWYMTIDGQDRVSITLSERNNNVQIMPVRTVPKTELGTYIW